MPRYKLRESDDGINIVAVTELYASPQYVAVKIKDVIDILEHSNYVKKEDRMEFLQQLLDKGINIGQI